MTSPEQLTMTDLTTGQVSIIHIRFPDADRAFWFYGQLLDWESEPYWDEGFTAHYVTNTELLTVLTDDPTAPSARLWFSVTDLPVAVEVVTQLGGAVEDSQMTDDGGWARVTDGQGTPLGLWRPRGNYPTPPSPTRPKGEVGYVTVHVADSRRAVAFYEGLLGWRFQEPRSADYHHVDNLRLSLGLYGNHDQPSVEWYIRVSDIASLVPRVAELGGEAGPISESRSGLSATCTDDQGVTLRLWQPGLGY